MALHPSGCRLSAPQLNKPGYRTAKGGAMVTEPWFASPIFIRHSIGCCRCWATKPDSTICPVFMRPRNRRAFRRVAMIVQVVGQEKPRPLRFSTAGSAPLVPKIAISMRAMDNRRRNLGFFFDDTVARLPDKVAIIDLFGGRERCATYRQLDERMDAVARLLARLGVEPGERVAMLIGNRTEFIEIFFGAMRAGAIPLPLNTRLAADTLERMIADARCVLMIV